jgi:hypothetical protein
MSVPEHHRIRRDVVETSQSGPPGVSCRWRMFPASNCLHPTAHRRHARCGRVGVNLPTSDEAAWRVGVTEGIYTRWQGATAPLQKFGHGAAIAADGMVIIAVPATDERTAATAPQRAIGLVGHALAVPVRSEQLFGFGLALQGAASRTAKPDFGSTIDAQIEEVDTIIRKIRSTVFSLDRRRPSLPNDVGTPAD